LKTREKTAMAQRPSQGKWVAARRTIVSEKGAIAVVPPLDYAWVM